MYFDETDETLVTLTLLGRLEAYEALVLRWQKAVLYAAQTITRNRYMAEDAAQDAFVSAWIKLNMLRSPDKYGAWVCRIAKNAAKNMMARCEEFVSIEVLENREWEKEEAVEAMLVSSEETDLLSDSIDTLPEKVRRVIRLHYYEGLSIAEIAARLSVPVGTVKWQLSEGRRRIRKDVCAMDERDNDTLVQKVMKKVEELKLLELKNNKAGFEQAYREILTAVEELPETVDKFHAMADVLLRGWWWVEGEKNDTMFARLKQAAFQGRNEQVICSVLRIENRKLSGKDRMEFMLNTQIPMLEENGFVKALGYAWFWLGRECFVIGETEKGQEAYHKVLQLLKPSDVYYAAALSAIRAEKLCEGMEKNRYCMTAMAEEYRKVDGTFRSLHQPSYVFSGYLTGGERIDCPLWSLTRCDHYFPDPKMKPGDVICGSHSDQSLTFAEDHVTVETPCGVFEDCEHWITKGKWVAVHTYIKEGVGIVRQDTKGEKRLLKRYEIRGGEGKIPFATGNVWEYDGGYPASIVYECRSEITYADGDQVIASTHCFYHRKSYDETVWEDMMLAAKNLYANNAQGTGFLREVRPYLEKAASLAKTRLEREHTRLAASVMERIFTTDPDFNPEGEQKGYWNFFEYSSVDWKQGRLLMDKDRKYGFEWKDWTDYPNGWWLLFNDIYGLLENSCGCLWDEAWQDGLSTTIEHDHFILSTKTALTCEVVGTVTTAAGTFDDCLLLLLTIDGLDGGLGYRGGKKFFTLAPGVGIVRFVSPYADGNVVYELTRYEGTGEGYFPMADGFVRRYDAVGIADGYIGSAEYVCCQKEDGQLILLTDRCGVGPRKKKDNA